MAAALAISILNSVTTTVGSDSPPPTLRLAGLFPMQGAWSGGVSVAPAVEMALQDVNSDTGVLPHTRLEMVALDSACDVQTATTAFFDAHMAHTDLVPNSTDPPLVGLLGAGCSGVCEALSLLSKTWHYPMLSYACTSATLSDATVYPNFLRTTVPDTAIAEVWMALCRHFGWARVGLVRQSGGLFEATSERFEQLVRASPGMLLESAPSALATDGHGAAGAAAALRASGVRIIFFACYPPAARALFRALYAAGMYGPGFQYLTLGWLPDGWWSDAVGGDANVSAVAQYHMAVSKTTCGATPTARCTDFAARFQSAHPTLPYIAHVHWAYDVVWAWARALDAAIQRDGGASLYDPNNGSDDPSRMGLWWQLRNLSFDGVSGPVAFDMNGDRRVDTVTFEVDNMQPADDYDGGWVMRAVGTYSGGVLHFHAPYRFAGGRSTPPRSLKPVVALLMPITDGAGTPLSASWDAVSCAALLAVRHVNARDGRAVTELGAWPDDGFQLGQVLLDTTTEPRRAMEAYKAAREAGVHAIVGPAHSRLSRYIAFDAGFDSIPQLSYWSSDSALSDREMYPSFGRAIYSNQQTGTLLAAAIRANFGWRHVGVLHLSDEYGRDLASSFALASQNEGIFVTGQVEFSYEAARLDDEIRSAVQRAIAPRGLTIFVIICFSTHILMILRAARDFGALTASHAWIWVDGATMLHQIPTLSPADAGLLHGLLAFEWTPSAAAAAPLNRIWASMTPDDCSNDDAPGASAFRPLASIFDNPPSSTARLAYDSVIAMALALHGEHDPRNGTVVLAQLDAQRFNGTSGVVQFDTGRDRLFGPDAFLFHNFVRVQGTDATNGTDAEDARGRIQAVALPVGTSAQVPSIVWIGGGSTAPVDLIQRAKESERHDALMASGLVLGIALPVFCIIIAYVRYRRRVQRSESLLRYRATGLPPVLRMPNGCCFHLFLSHTWKSGQDQCAVIKRQLTVMLNEVRTFLDVDDLVDVNDIERHVQESAVIICFLSRGYFLSAPSMREVRAAIRYGKPIITVHEEVMEKGGEPLDMLMNQCPEDIYDVLFPAGAIPIPWQRSKPMQWASLALIAEALLNTVAKEKDNRLVYASTTALQPTWVHAFKLAHAPVLYVSNNNPGAAKVAALLTRATVGLVVESGAPIQDRPLTRSNSYQRTARTRSISGAAATVVSSSRNLVHTTHATHMLLYLNDQTFMGEAGERLANEIKWVTELSRQRQRNIRILLVHETRADHGGCPFDRFFHVTPASLVRPPGDLYKPVAVPLHAHPRHIAVALCQIAIDLGAVALNPKLQKSHSPVKYGGGSSVSPMEAVMLMEGASIMAQQSPSIVAPKERHTAFMGSILRFRASLIRSRGAASSPLPLSTVLGEEHSSPSAEPRVKAMPEQVEKIGSDGTSETAAIEVVRHEQSRSRHAVQSEAQSKPDAGSGAAIQGELSLICPTDTIML